ncbi:MAG: hypothetical protein F9B45_18145 [Phycisphaera sp. RhM]|nr:hypothetical protein [Phycisphaera sp. RhM]
MSRPVRVDLPLIVIGRIFGYGYVSFDDDVELVGRIVIAGRVLIDGSFQYGVARLEANGTIDTGFGVNGRATLSILDGNDEPRAGLVIQDDGKIVVVGRSLKVGDDWWATAARFLPDGQLDASFGSGGVLIADPVGVNQSWFSVEVTAEQKLLFSGFERLEGGEQVISVRRYDPAGRPDPGFGINGKLVFDTESRSSILATAIADDGSFVAVGRAQDEGGIDDFAIIKLRGSDFELQPLVALRNLEDLSISNNQIIDVSPLAEIDSLRSVDLDDNLITSIDSLLGQMIIDNGDAGFVEVGPVWTGGSHPGAFEDDYRIAPGIVGETAAVYQFENLSPGEYTVYATWPEHESRTTAARFEAYSAAVHPVDPNADDLLLHLPLDFTSQDATGVSSTRLQDNFAFTTDHAMGIGAATLDGGVGSGESGLADQVDALVVESPIDFNHDGIRCRCGSS